MKLLQSIALLLITTIINVFIVYSVASVLLLLLEFNYHLNKFLSLTIAIVAAGATLMYIRFYHKITNSDSLLSRNNEQDE